MPTLTHNLFWGQGEREHQLDVVEGRWPSDISGAVFVVGPDKRTPGGHWLGEQGLLQKIHCKPDAQGRIRVEHKLVHTPLYRLRARLPWLFKKLAFMEISPFGVTNMVNTNVQPIEGRLFIGYDAGRPVEVDPESLEFHSYVGANDEWLLSAPGVFEPLAMVAAHPAPDFDEKALYFVNYAAVRPPDEPAPTFLARWKLGGALERWRVDVKTPFESIHDIKATRDHLVFSDLPFIVEPQTFRGGARTKTCPDHTLLWIVSKEDLRKTAPGGTLPAREVRIPHPTGHLSVDYDDAGGRIRVFLQHVPFVDFMVTMDRDTLSHADGRAIDPNFEGFIATSPQPGAIGRYEIDAASGAILDSQLSWDDGFWGSLLATQDTFRPAARARQRQLFYSGTGYDPELVSQEWWSLYGERPDGIVPPSRLPKDARPGALARFDLELMKVAELYRYADGAFPHPPTFVPREGSDDPDDGYVVVVVHRNGPKEIHVFDAAHLARGPIARATAPNFNPNLMLHSHWMPTRNGPRPSTYRIPILRDIQGALRAFPSILANLVRVGRRMPR